MQLDGKTALITGGGSGIGAAIARSFAQQGARVAIVGRNEEQLKQTCAAIDAPEPVRFFAASVNDRAQVRALIEWAATELGPLDMLVNNAGINIAARRMEVLAAEDWDALLEVNATGSFNMIQAVLPQMRARRSGLIISVASIAAHRPGILAGAAYSAAKQAMAALTNVVWQEEAPNGIRASVLCPGEVNTPLLDRRPTPVSAEHKARILQPEDVAAAALFIATLPPRACVPELLITPTHQTFG